MHGCPSAALATSFQNLTTNPWGAVIENRGSFFIHAHGVAFWNPPPQFQFPNFASIRIINPLLPPVASSSQSHQLSLSSVEDEIQNHPPDQDDSLTVHIRLQLCRKCQFGQEFLVVGDHPALGMWNPLDAFPMVWTDGHVWTAELDMPVGQLIQFKFILRETSGDVLWQPGPNRLLHTPGTGKTTTVVFGDWEKVAVRQVTEECFNDNRSGDSDELMLYEKKQSIHLESYEGNVSSLNAQDMAMVAENIEQHTLQESGFLRVQEEADASRIEVEAQGFNSQAVEGDGAISNKSLRRRRKRVLETKQEIPVLVPGLTACMITPVEDETVTEEELELNASGNSRNAMEENSAPESFQHHGKTQIQLDEKQEGVEGCLENEEEDEVQEVTAEVLSDKKHTLIEYPNKPASGSNHEPDPGVQLILFDGQDNRSNGILHNDLKWGQETLRRFLDKLGFRLRI